MNQIPESAITRKVDSRWKQIERYRNTAASGSNSTTMNQKLNRLAEPGETTLEYAVWNNEQSRSRTRVE